MTMARPNSCNGGRSKADRTEVISWLKNRVSKGPVELAVIQQEYEKLGRESLEFSKQFSKEAFKIARKELRDEIVPISRHGVWWLVDMTVANRAIPSATAPRTIFAQEARKLLVEDRASAARQEMLDYLTELAQGDGIDALKGIPKATPERCLQTMQQRLDENDSDYGITREQLVQIEKQHGPTAKIAERATRVAAKQQREQHRSKMIEIAQGCTKQDECSEKLFEYAIAQKPPLPVEWVTEITEEHGPKVN
jgi:hypothetical protein